ncbi:reverse transcriptase domain-containing protein [Tanacetum coccineum]
MTVNAECSAIIMNKVPEKLEDPGKFLIPCALQELDRTRITLELANRSITHPMGIAEDVVVRVDGFTFLADFVVVNFEPDPRVPIILGRPFLRTAKALIDFGSTTTHSDDPSPSSSPVKTSDNLEEFIDELTLLKKIFKKEIFKIIQILFLNLMTISNLFYSTTPLSDRLMCFAPEDDNDEDRCFSSYGSFFFIFEEEVLCEISTSQSQENVHANQSSIYQGHLPVSPIPVEDSEPAQEEIDIFLVPDDLIPPGVENDDSEDEVNELPNLDHHIIRQFLVLSGTTGLDPTISEDSRVRVRIYQKSQENHQKRKTRTRERKSMQEPEAKVKKSACGQPQNLRDVNERSMGSAQTLEASSECYK